MNKDGNHEDSTQNMKKYSQRHKTLRSSDMVITRIKRTKVLYMSLGAIFSAFVVEMTLGVISNSLALITDSIHALLDCLVTAILLIAAKMALKPPDAEHTYGHGKIESLGGMIGGIAILVIACFFIYESLHRLQEPPPSIIPGMLAMAGGAYTICVDIFRIVLLKKSLTGENKTSVTIKTDMYHAIMDLGTTGIAIIGIMFAYMGTYQGDHIAALVLGGLLVALSIKLIHRTALDLTDVISPDMVSEVHHIVNSTRGVVSTGAVLMRRSGDTIFADITILLRGDVSFDRAHEISADVERNILQKIKNASVTVHFEPEWHNVPVDSKISDIAKNIKGVKGVHNVNTYKKDSDMYADLHVMVDSATNLTTAHKISEMVETKIKDEIPEIIHTTVHLEPFTTIPKNFDVEDVQVNEKIRTIISKYPQVCTIGRIISLSFENVFKIDVDCSFDGNMSIEEVHKLVSTVERAIASEIDNAIITIHPEPI